MERRGAPLPVSRGVYQMSKLSTDAWLGIGVMALGLFLLLVLIPYGITSPANVRIAVLSPTIWPNIIAGALVILGAIQFARSLAAGRGGETGTVSEADAAGEANGWQPWARIGAVALIMAGLFFSLPLIGMPIAGVLAILAYALLVRAGRPVTAALTAIILPLTIYAFFNHVAKVPIPQGKIVRLP